MYWIKKSKNFCKNNKRKYKKINNSLNKNISISKCHHNNKLINKYSNNNKINKSNNNNRIRSYHNK